MPLEDKHNPETKNESFLGKALVCGYGGAKYKNNYVQDNLKHNYVPENLVGQYEHRKSKLSEEAVFDRR